MQTLDPTTARKMNQILNDGVAPGHVLVESLAQEWTVPEMVVFEGYVPTDSGIRAAYQALTKADLIQDWIDLVNKHKFLKGHIYRLFARYRITAHGKRQYVGPHLRRDDDLTAQHGQIVKVMEVTL